MLNQSIRNIALPGLMTLLIIGLLVHLAGQTVAPVLAQDGGTATSTPEDNPSATSTPESGQDEATAEMATITTCTVNAETGESVCTQTTEPISEDDVVRSGYISGQGGITGAASPSLSLTLGSKSLTVGDTTSLKMKGSNLSSRYQYTMKVSRSSTSALTGFLNCDNHSYSYGAPRSGFTSLSKTITLYACAAGSQTIIAELQRPGSGSGGENDVIVVDRRSITVTVNAALSSSTATTTPSSTSTAPTPTPTARPSTSAIPPTPAAPKDVRGHWDVNLAPGKFSGSYIYYGYQTRLIGSVSGDTFEYEGVTYTVTFFKWDQSAKEITFKLDKCLKPSAFSGLRIGNLTFDEIDDESYTDSQCGSNSGRDQRFDFDVSTNPLPVGSPVRVTLLLKLPEPFVITPDPEFPSARGYVNLSVPDYGNSYQWQQWSGGKWTNLGSVSTSPRKRVSFSTQGTRKFRVVANPGKTTSAESPAIHVTWDVWKVGLGLVTTVSSAVATSTDYKTAQTALLTCVNTGRAATSRYTSFDDVLADYTGTTKTKMESGGSCHAKAKTMFSAYERLTKSALDSHNTSTSEYFLFLESDEGKDLTSGLGNADELRNLAIYASAPLPSPGELVAPFYTSSASGGVAGQSDTRPARISLDTGVNCLPSGIDGSKLTVTNKLKVLNCLVFHTPHSFWVSQLNTSIPSVARLRDNPKYSDWLESDDWECTFPGLDGPMPACWKHDFAFNGLQRFAGEADEDSWGSELDVTWNPKNKALADLRFKADILKYGCQNPSNIAKNSVCTRTNVEMADWYFWGVAERNHKGWPVISKDLRGFTTDPETLILQEPDLRNEHFEICTEPVFPDISDVRVVPSGDTVTLSWNFQAGCTAELSDVEFNATWYIKPPVLLYFAPVEGHATGSCTTAGDRVSCAYDFSHWQSGANIRHVELKIVPANREYGGEEYRHYRMYVGHKLR